MPAAAAAPETDEDVRIAAAAADVVEVATVRLSVADDDLGGGEEHVELFFVLLLKLPRKESILPVRVNIVLNITKAKSLELVDNNFSGDIQAISRLEAKTQMDKA